MFNINPLVNPQYNKVLYFVISSLQSVGTLMCSHMITLHDPYDTTKLQGIALEQRRSQLAQCLDPYASK